MPHSFDVETESSASVGQIHAAFRREEYWLARLAGDAVTTLDSLLVDPDGTVAMRATQQLGRQLLPGPIAAVVPGGLELVHSETWRPVGNGQLRGQITTSAVGGLGSSLAENLLAPSANGSRMRSAVKVQVKIPLVGGRLEKFVGAGVAGSIPAIVRFTTTWIAENT